MKFRSLLVYLHGTYPVLFWYASFNLFFLLQSITPKYYFYIIVKRSLASFETNLYRSGIRLQQSNSYFALITHVHELINSEKNRVTHIKKNLTKGHYLHYICVNINLLITYLLFKGKRKSTTKAYIPLTHVSFVVVNGAILNVTENMKKFAYIRLNYKSK